jgi:hypothetical protein
MPCELREPFCSKHSSDCTDYVLARPGPGEARADAFVRKTDLPYVEIDARTAESSKPDSMRCKELAAGSFTLS